MKLTPEELAAIAPFIRLRRERIAELEEALATSAKNSRAFAAQCGKLNKELTKQIARANRAEVILKSRAA